jgi:hypothetical protein
MKGRDGGSLSLLKPGGRIPHHALALSHKNQVTISTENYYPDGSISLHNSAGMTIIHEKVINSTHTLFLNKLPSGLYLIIYHQKKDGDL